MKLALAVGAEAAEVRAVEIGKAIEPDTVDVSDKVRDMLDVIAEAVSAEVEMSTAATDDDLSVLDLHKLRSEERPAREWLENELIALRQITKITAGSGVGKTIFKANLGLCWSLGRAALDIENGKPRQLTRPLRVLYIDGEVGPDWWAEYLDKMAAPLELPNLLVKSFPDWPPLTTTYGAAMFWELVDHHQPDVVILDTLSSFIDGDENDSSTWIAFDNRITLPLKARGLTAIFADHTGKNTDLGARGSSAKSSKIDVEWSIEQSPKGSNGLLLRNLKARTGRLPEKVRLRRVDGPLAHVRSGEDVAAGIVSAPMDAKVMSVIDQLDAWNVAVSTGQPTISTRLRAEGFKVGDETVRQAIKHRRQRDAK